MNQGIDTPSHPPYWETAELEKVTRCPACGSLESDVRHAGLHDLLLGVPGDWSMQECTTCASLYLDPRPTPDSIHKAYGMSEYFTHLQSHADEGHSWIWRQANGYLNSRFGCRREPASVTGRFFMPLLAPLRLQLDYFFRHLPEKPGRLLDVGCGNGAFLQRAASAGWEVHGIEPDVDAARQAATSGSPVHVGTLDTFASDSREFDVITLSHVFEHVHDPAATLSACNALLKEGGVLWMALPSIEGLGHRFYGRHWFPLDPPRHLLLPSREQLASLIAKSGFSNIRFLRRGRTSPTQLRLSAERAGRSPTLASLLQWLVSIGSCMTTRLADEFIVVATKHSP